MAMSSSLPELRPAMDVDLFMAAINGKSGVLIPHLGIRPGEPDEMQVTIEEGSVDLASQQTEAEHHVVQSELGAATNCGDTLLHLLIIGGHNKLAMKVFIKDMSLLKARNNKLETPLHNAAKVGNKEIVCSLVGLSQSVVTDALRETNENGDTALHVAANLNHNEIVIELMKLDPQVAYKKNNQGFPPLYIAIVEGHTSLVKAMLQADLTLACTQFSDRTFPVHVAARMGNEDLVCHFLRKYPDYAKLLDSCGRNFFHHMAEQIHSNVLTELIKRYGNPQINQKAEKMINARDNYEGNSPLHEINLRLESIDNEMHQINQMIESLINAKDYEGNTPLHIAAMRGHRSAMKAIWNKLNHDWETLEIRNQKFKTAFEISYEQISDVNKDDIQLNLYLYANLKGRQFTKDWFDDVMDPPPYKNLLERTQIIGLGSVLITTVAFAAAFTIPGGYNADNGTPILGKRFTFKAFILANTLAFIQAFESLFMIVTRSLFNPTTSELTLAMDKFISAASCMLIAFGFGSYVILAPVNLPIAIIVLAVALLIGSPALILITRMQRYFQKRISSWPLQRILQRSTFCLRFCRRFVLLPASYLTLFGLQIIPLLFILCVAFL